MSFSFFSTDQYLGFIRHLLTVGGGSLVTKGILDQETLNTIVGAVMTLIGFGWSLISNSPVETTIKQATTDTPPKPTPPAANT